MKRDIFYKFCSILIFFSLTSCYTNQYGSLYQEKNMKRFSVAKTNGFKRHFLKKPKKKLNPSYTKYAKDWNGE